VAATKKYEVIRAGLRQDLQPGTHVSVEEAQSWVNFHMLESNGWIRLVTVEEESSPTPKKRAVKKKIIAKKAPAKKRVVRVKK